MSLLLLLRPSGTSVIVEPPAVRNQAFAHGTTLTGLLVRVEDTDDENFTRAQPASTLEFARTDEPPTTDFTRADPPAAGTGFTRVEPTPV